MEKIMYTLTLKKGEEKRILQGHPWVYANEVAKIDGQGEQGSIAKVQGQDGRFIGYGFINLNPKLSYVFYLAMKHRLIERFFIIGSRLLTMLG